MYIISNRGGYNASPYIRIEISISLKSEVAGLSLGSLCESFRGADLHSQFHQSLFNYDKYLAIYNTDIFQASNVFQVCFMYTTFIWEFLVCGAFFFALGTGIIRLETRAEDCRTLIPDMSAYCCCGPCACYQTLDEPETDRLFSFRDDGTGKALPLQ